MCVAVDALHRHRARQLEMHLQAAQLWQDTDFVFTRALGTPIHPRNLVRHFKSMLTRAGIADTSRFYDLRHTCAILLLVQGVHPRVVMEMLGHSRIALTMDTYSHVSQELQRTAADRLNALLAPPSFKSSDDSSRFTS